MSVWKYLLGAAVFGVAPSFGQQFASETGTPCTTTLAPGADIQLAINNASPGSVICLEAGTYTPTGTIELNKQIELRGPQSNVDPRTTCASTRTDPTLEAVIDGGNGDIILSVTSDDVTIDGLTIQNGRFDLISSPAGGGITNLNIRNNIVTDASGDEGIQIRDCASCVIELNLVFDTEGDGINMCCGSTNGAIRFNEVHAIRSSNAAIYVYEADSIAITDNYVYDVINNDAIKMGGSGCASNLEAPNGSIERNVVRDVVQDGITVYSSNTVVRGNQIFDSASENGALYIACEDTVNVDVSNNIIYNNGGSTVGVQVGGGSTSPANVDTIVINNNCIQDNSQGLVNEATDEVDAQNNWWGAASGPGAPAGTGSGNGVSSNVDFDPFLDTPPEACQTANLFSNRSPDSVPAFCPPPTPPVDFPTGCEGDFVKPDECLGVLTLLSGNCVLYFDDASGLQTLGASNEMDCIALPSCSAEQGSGEGSGKGSGKGSGEGGGNGSLTTTKAAKVVSPEAKGERVLRQGTGRGGSKGSSKGSKANSGSVACNYNSRVPSTVGLSLSPDSDEVCGNAQSFTLVCTDGPPELSVTCPMDAYPFASSGSANIQVMPAGFTSTTATYALQPTGSFVINNSGMTMYDLAIGCVDTTCLDACRAAATM